MLVFRLNKLKTVGGGGGAEEIAEEIAISDLLFHIYVLTEVKRGSEPAWIGLQ